MVEPGLRGTAADVTVADVTVAVVVAMAAEAVAMVQQEMEAALFRTAAAHEKSAMCLGEAEAGLARRWARCRWRVPHMHLHIVQVYIVHLHIVHLHIVP